MQRPTRLLFVLAVLGLLAVAWGTGASLVLFGVQRDTAQTAVDLTVGASPRSEGAGPRAAALPILAAGLLSGALVLALTRLLGRRVERLKQQVEELQARLAEQAQRFEAIVEDSSDGILMASDKAGIELVNPAAEVLLGRLREDLVGSELDELIPELSEHAADDRQDTGVLSTPTGLSSTYEISLLHANGHHFPARIRLRSLGKGGIERRILLLQDLTESAQQARQMEFLEQRDAVTGLLNRREFERRMDRILTDAIPAGRPYALCYIDVDRFMLVNDTVGHTAGDAMLAQLAKLIHRWFDDAVLLARLGGDEFGVLFGDCTEPSAVSRCEGLRQRIRSFPFTWRDSSFDITVSIGVTVFEPVHDSATVELAKADVACHIAKSQGRDRVHAYRDGEAASARHHEDMRLAATISQSLNKGRFRLYAQPIIALAGPTDGPHHHEILVRMLNNDGTGVVPGHFIPVAERYQLMPAIDRWIIHHLFDGQGERLRSWHQEHPEEFLYAINLSGTSINDESFLPFLKRQFEAWQIPPSTICFEITETAALGNLDGASHFMRELAAMGCRFALDDFGTGLSSYAYLRQLPLNYLKIDGSFVHDMNRDPVNRALVTSINQVAHILGLQTIAEWAEDQATVNLLRALHVDFVQGYAVGMPTPIMDVEIDPDSRPANADSRRA